MNSLIRPTVVVFALLLVLTGFVYPLLVTGVASIAFPGQAGGSLLVRSGKQIGSRLIGQSFSSSRHFWSRPSATAPQPYNGTASGGSNFGSLNPALTNAVKMRIGALRAASPGADAAVPVDLVTASGSGLDPDISVAAARYQVARVAHARGIDESAVRSLLARQQQGRLWGILGEPRVNVVELNLALDELSAPR